MLSRSVDPSAIRDEILSSVPQWQATPELREPYARISSLLPPKPDSIPPVAVHSAPLTRELLVQVLDDTVRELQGTTDDEQLQFNCDTLRRKFARLRQENGTAVPTSPAVLFAGAAREISGEVIERQMEKAVRDALAKVTHDANNMLGVLMGEMAMAEERYRRVDVLARTSFDAIPVDMKARLDGYLLSMEGVLAGMSDLLVKTSQRVRTVQRIIHPSSDPNGPTVLDLSRLRAEGGAVAQIMIVLFDLLKDVRKGEENLREMNLIADQFGGQTLLCELSEYFQTADELTTLIVDLFRLHQEFVSDLKNGKEGSVDLHAYLNRRILRAFMGRRVEVVLDLDDAPWKIPGPSIRVWQIILNNIVNARDAMGCGGRLSVATRKVVLSEEDAWDFTPSFVPVRPRSGDFMLLEIGDNGPGIPHHILPRIFEPSFSGKQSSGLGLAVTLQIVQNRGGFITVRTSTDSENHGTVFSIYLPRIEEESPAPVRRPSESGKEIVLIVDADDAVLRSTRRDLMEQGYGVVTAPSVAEAVARSRDWYKNLERPPIGAVLIDLHSAGGEARSLLETLRTIDPYMVCLFQNGTGAFDEGLQELEMAGFVDKAALIDELVGQMRFFLSRMRKSRPTIPAPQQPQPKPDDR